VVQSMRRTYPVRREATGREESGRATGAVALAGVATAPGRLEVER
jgi:hypothetical protein